MQRMIVALAVCALVASTLPADAKAEGHWTTHTTANGLLNNGIMGLATTPDGGLWGVNGQGLSHFDGTTWTHYSTEDGLASNSILWFESTIAVGADGVLWVGTFDAGVSRFDGETWTTYTTEEGLLSNVAVTVAVAPNGEVWAGHFHDRYGGLSHFDGETWTAYPGAGLGSDWGGAAVLAFEPGGVLWAGSSRFDGETWTHYKNETLAALEVNVGPVDPYNVGPIGALEVAPDGTVWACGGGGLYRFDGTGWEHFSFGEMGVAQFEGDEGFSALAMGPDGTLWAGTLGQGVFRYDGKTWVHFTEADGLANNAVFSIVQAPDGALWFGTGNGLSRYLPGPTAVSRQSWGEVKRVYNEKK